MTHSFDLTYSIGFSQWSMSTSPYIQEPDLLEPDPETEYHSCAEMCAGTSLTEAQSLMVNRMAATIVAQYTAVFVLQRQILHLSNTFNLAPPTLTTELITRQVIDQYKTPC